MIINIILHHITKHNCVQFGPYGAREWDLVIHYKEQSSAFLFIIKPGDRELLSTRRRLEAYDVVSLKMREQGFIYPVHIGLDWRSLLPSLVLFVGVPHATPAAKPVMMALRVSVSAVLHSRWCCIPSVCPAVLRKCSTTTPVTGASTAIQHVPCAAKHQITVCLAEVGITQKKPW